MTRRSRTGAAVRSRGPLPSAFAANWRRSVASSGSVYYLYDLAGHVIAEVNSSGGWNRGETRRLRPERSCGIYAGARYDASSLGRPDAFTDTGRSALSEPDRFMSPDWSAKVEPVPYAKLADPQSLNLYAYVLDNPTTSLDLDGHACEASGPNACPVPPPTQTSSKSVAQQKTDNAVVGRTSVGALEKTMSNEDRSLSGGAPGQLEKGKNAMANAIINNALLQHPAKVAPATGTPTKQDARIMRAAFQNRPNGGSDPVNGRTQYGTTHNPNVRYRSAMNHLKGAAGRETMYMKFGPFKDSVSGLPTWIVIYNDPGHY